MTYYIDAYLRFASRQEYVHVTANMRDADGMIVLPPGVTLRIVGTITHDGDVDEDFNVITPPDVRPGYHVNICLTRDGEDGTVSMPEPFIPFLIPNPERPKRVRME